MTTKPQKRRKRVKSIGQPLALTASYARSIVAWVREMRDLALDVLVPAFDIARVESFVRDSAEDTLERALETVEFGFGEIATPVNAATLAAGTAEATQRWHKRRFTNQMRAALGVDPLLNEPYLREVLRGFTRWNVNLIGSIGPEFHKQIESEMWTAWRSGRTGRDLAKDIRERYGVAESRARLIARDQMAKLNGQLSMVRQGEVGISHYFWRTSEDERVRPTHQANNNAFFAWNDPHPVTGHPGWDYQCRCTAEPDFDTLLEPEQVPG